MKIGQSWSEAKDQPYLFAYSKSTGAILRDFDPLLNNKVLALQTTGEGTGIFVGGAFTTVNGETNRKGLVKLDNLGKRVRGFSARPNKRVFTMDRSGNTLYIGGNFDRIGQTPIEYLAAIRRTGDHHEPESVINIVQNIQLVLVALTLPTFWFEKAAQTIASR